MNESRIGVILYVERFARISAPLSYLFVRVTCLLVLCAICLSFEYVAASFSVSASSRDARALLSSDDISSQAWGFIIGSPIIALRKPVFGYIFNASGVMTVSLSTLFMSP